MNDFDDVVSDSIAEFEPSSDVEDWAGLEIGDLDLTNELELSESCNELWDDTSIGTISDAEMAADYARSFGFEKAADYIERHYDGDVFVPGEPIRVTTRNMSLDGETSENGVPFERRTAELADGLAIEGVFPEFDSKYHVELGQDAKDMSLHQQFSACREDF